MDANMMNRFPREIQDFANCFVSSQEKRHLADYDPSKKLTKSEVIAEIDTMESAIKSFEGVSKKDKRAFAAYVIFKKRKT